MRVVVADDSLLVRVGIVRLLGEAGFEVVGEASDPTQLLALADSVQPDVAVVDIRMPPTHTDEGVRAAAELRARQPRIGILVLSQHITPAYARDLLGVASEGIGYLLKDRVSDVDELADAIRRVANGGCVLDPLVVRQLVGRAPHADDPLRDLSDREREVLGLMAEGRSNHAIAERLFITEHTVEKHVQAIFAKLGLEATPDDHRRVLAVLAFLDSR